MTLGLLESLDTDGNKVLRDEEVRSIPEVARNVVDQNQDGLVDMNELRAWARQGAEAQFALLDVEKKGLITFENYFRLMPRLVMPRRQ